MFHMKGANEIASDSHRRYQPNEFFTVITVVISDVRYLKATLGNFKPSALVVHSNRQESHCAL